MMEYRTIPKTNEKVSVLGVGSGYMHELSQDVISEIIDYSLGMGVNLIDTCIAYPGPLDMVGKALKGRRDKALLQMHLGMTFPNGQYERTRKLAAVKKGFEQQLTELGTDYTDIGFIHYVDEQDDFEEMADGGVLDYARKLKKDGTIRYLGFASHSVEICNLFLELGDFDICLFSVNAAYDLDPVKNLPFEGFVPERQDQLAVSKDRDTFYKECEKRGVGIHVMKPLGGGILLDENTTPFEKPMTVNQCLQYALDRPAVLSCVLGMQSKSDMVGAMEYFKASKEEKDYAFIAGMQHKDMKGTCVYCNHCLPCPANIDIAAVHKYFDLFQAGDKLAKEHYLSLKQRAKDCIQCGDCEKNCPFQVKIQEKMAQAAGCME